MIFSNGLKRFAFLRYSKQTQAHKMPIKVIDKYIKNAVDKSTSNIFSLKYGYSDLWIGDCKSTQHLTL